MGTVGFNRKGDFKADRPHATIVLRIPSDQITVTKTLINAYADDLPEQLKDILTIIKTQLPEV